MTKPTKWVCAQGRLRSACASAQSDQSLRYALNASQWVAKDPSFLHADSEDSDQTGPMPRLIWVIAGHTLILLVLTCHGSNVCECDVGRDVCRAVLTAVFIIHRKGSRFYDHINTSVQYRTCSNSIFSFIDLCGWWNIKKVIIRLTLIS